MAHKPYQNELIAEIFYKYSIQVVTLRQRANDDDAEYGTEKEEDSYSAISISLPRLRDLSHFSASTTGPGAQQARAYERITPK